MARKQHSGSTSSGSATMIDRLAPSRQEIARRILAEPRTYVLLSLRTASRRLKIDAATLLRVLNQLGITHRRTAYNHPKGNSYIERFHRSLKEEEVWLNEYQTFDQAQLSIARWIRRVQSRPSASRTPRQTPHDARARFAQTLTSNTAPCV
jgi:transposase InsO family protein